MSTLLGVTELLLLVAVFVPSALALVFSLEIVALALAPRPVRAVTSGPRPRTAVLMPAHDEAAGIHVAIRSVQAALAPGDRLLVVADNCSDDTAAVARSLGAEVVERTDAQRRGKGYALAFGVDVLRASPPDVVTIVDADCRVSRHSLARLGASAVALGRPAQALYLMRAPSGASLKQRVAAFAWRVKNYARPEGARRLGLPCALMGTGMAFPYALIEDAQLASGHLVEDMELGVNLALEGKGAEFCPRALVESDFPQSSEGARSQRTRWEHGHLEVIRTHAPRLLSRAISTGDGALLGFALDLAVPPLAALVLLLALSVTFTGAYWLVAERGAPLFVALSSTAALIIAVLWARALVGRKQLTLVDLLSVPGYVLAKLPVYGRYVGKRQASWVRTARDPEPTSSAAPPSSDPR